MDDLPSLTTAETAARLGVKPASLYAYVSRGLLTRMRTAHGSRFDALEVERFARSRRRADPVGVVPGSPLMVLDTDIALIEDGNLYFRGHDALELTRERSFERLARWIWGQPDSAAPFVVDSDAWDAARSLAAAVPGDAALTRMRAAVLGLGAHAAGADTAATPQAAVRAGERLLAVLPRVVGGSAGFAEESVAKTLAVALSGRESTPELVAVMDRALGLAIDHDLAVSTLAARVAASARSSAYASVSAALAAFDSPLHGTVSRDAVVLLRRVHAGQSPARALRAGDTARFGIPGFGHRIYRGPDPRALAILEDIAALDHDGSVRGAVAQLSAAVRDRAGLHPNIDLALAALVLAGGLRDDAGVVLFGIGRVVGWIAHIADEYQRAPMRLRPQGRYTGP
ncbi:citrate synthase [Microbacterium sp. ZW T5_56]|uniref:citrate synthase n=1 Tax=Microbacterium sp. ZW T5_56 TaxID=3378081 RepID=UPI00385436FD